MLVNTLIGVLGILIFLFIFWKKLKEDYAPEIIFKAATFILAGILAGWILSINFFSAWFFWWELAGGLIGLGIVYFKLKVRFYETLEAFVISMLPWFSLVFLKDSVFNFSFTSFAAFLATLVFIFVYYYFDVHYKNFAWYRSGKIGFSGLAILSLIFLVRSVLALTGIRVISFVGQYEAMVSGGAAFICFLQIFNLGRIEK